MCRSADSKSCHARRRSAGGLVLGILGALLLIAPWRDFGGSGTGALACLTAAFSYSIIARRDAMSGNRGTAGERAILWLRKSRAREVLVAVLVVY